MVRSATDLPTTTYVLDAPPSQAFLDPTFMGEVVPALHADAQRVLDDYDIQDPAILQRLRAGLAAIANLEGRPEVARGLIEAQRQSETKPQLAAVGLLLGDAIAAGGMASASERCTRAAARVESRLNAAPFEEVRDEALQYHAQLQVASVGYYAGTAVGAVDPAWRERGSITLLEGLRLAGWRMNLEQLPPCREQIANVMQSWLSNPAHQTADIWPDRDLNPDQLRDALPVTVAIWDSGFDPDLFADRLAIDPAEPLDGRDNDGNGVIDDANGPTFDHRLMPTSSPYPPLSDVLASRYAFQMAVYKGERDLGYGLDTPEARFFAQHGRDADMVEQGVDVESAGEIGLRSHGTAIASIIARDAPWVRLYNLAALPWGRAPGPTPYSEPEIERWTALMPGFGARLRGAGVRVVNMSWGAYAAEFSEALIEKGFETDPDRAIARGNAMYEKVSRALLTLMDACPDILFVTGSGNSNQPDEVLAAVPQTFRRPNLIVAGATAPTGRASSFSTFGDTVSLYALGENIALTLPGGVELRGEGTSYAAPGVARAAAAMLAVNPGLKAVDLIEGLTSTATDGEDGIRLLHTGAAVAWARRRIR